ncbi:MAG: hypothetical protein GXO79_07515, partial [Chlorobi bacterium]|nr:hypothetical protein [Chlorobiota bacterium]
MRKLLLIILLILTGNFYCLSKSILWERVPIEQGDWFEPNRNTCVISSDNKYIITRNRNWLSVYDAVNGQPLKNLYFDNSKLNISAKGLIDIYSRGDSNIIACSSLIYDKDNEIDESAKVDIYEIPSLRLIDSISKYPFINDFSNNFHYALWTQLNVFYIFDNTIQPIYYNPVYIDSVHSASTGFSFWSKIGFAPNGNYLVAIFEHNAYIFDIRNKKLYWKSTYDSVNNEIYDAIISNDMKYIVLASLDSIIVYDFQSKKKIKSFKNVQVKPNDIIRTISLALSDDNKYLAITSNGTSNYNYGITVMDFNNEKVISNINLFRQMKDLPDQYFEPEILFNIQFLKDNQYLLASGVVGNYLFNIFTGKLMNLYSTNFLIDMYDYYPCLISFANNDKNIITIGSDKTIIWDARTGAFIKALNLHISASRKNTIAIQHDSKQIIYSVDNKIYFYNFVDERLEKEITTDKDIITLAVSDNSKYIAYAFKNNSSYIGFRVYDIENDTILFEQPATLLNIKNVFVANNKPYLAYIQKSDYGNYNCIIKDYIENKVITTLQDIMINKIKFINNDSDLFYFYHIYYNNDKGYIIYNIDKKNVVKKHKLSSNTADFCLSADNKFFITSGPTIWNIDTGDSIQLHANPELNDMDNVAVSSDGTMLAAVSPEG